MIMYSATLNFLSHCNIHVFLQIYQVNFTQLYLTFYFSSQSVLQVVTRVLISVSHCQSIYQSSKSIGPIVTRVSLCLSEFCRVLTGSSKRDVQRAMWWKISAANTASRRSSASLLKDSEPLFTQ